MILAVLGTVATLVALLARTKRLRLLNELSGGLWVTAVASWTLFALEFFGSTDDIHRWTEVALFLAIGYVAARGLILVVVEWLLVQRAGVEVPSLGRDIISLLVYMFMAATVLRALLGIEVGALLATSAVVTVVIGLALQETLGTLLAGLALAWEKRLRAGEWVEIDSVVGRVEELGWRSVVLRGRLGERFLIPNSKAVNARILMLGRGEKPLAVSVQLAVAYGVPPDRVLEVLRPVAAETPGVVTRPAPQVLVVEFADSGIVYEARLWTLQPWRDFDLHSSFLTRAHAALLRAGMEIPFPQRTLHLAQRPEPVDMVEKRREILERCTMFSDLEPLHLGALASGSRWLRFAPDENILTQNDPSNELYVISSGFAEVNRSGRTVAQLQAGDVFGERALLTGEPRSADVRAETAVEAVRIDREALARVIDDHNDLAEALAGRMAVHDELGGDPSGATEVLTGQGGLVAQIRAQILRLVSS